MWNVDESRLNKFGWWWVWVGGGGVMIGEKNEK